MRSWHQNSKSILKLGFLTSTQPTTSGPDKSGSISKNDPDYSVLTQFPALILRGGLSEPASIISAGNIRVKGGKVELTTNGNIFTGNIDVSNNDPSYQTLTYFLHPVDPSILVTHTEWTQQPQGSIQLEAFNIFTGDLKSSSSAPITSYTAIYGTFHGGLPATDDSYIYTTNNSDSGGSISVNAEYLFRAGNIDTSSISGNGGSVSITASDALVGAINTSGGTENKVFDGIALGNDIEATHWTEVLTLAGGNITVSTNKPFQVGSINANGGTSGTVAIVETPNLPTNGGQKDGTVAIETSNLPTDVNGQGGTAIVLPPANEMAKPEVIRHRILVFTEARKLAGQKLTAQEIADKLDIPLELSQIAVLIPIGDSIKVPTPDLSELYNGSLYAGDGDALDPCGWPCKVIEGAGTLGTWAIKQLIKQIFQSKSESKDSGEENSGSGEESGKLTKGGKKVLGKLQEYKDKTAAEAIRERGGGAQQTRQLETGYDQKTVGEIANLAAQGDAEAIKAIKIIKQASQKNQKYGGK